MNRRSLELTTEQWNSLESLAVDFNTVPPTRRTPSWRTLIKLIANGDLIVTRKEHEHENSNIHTQ